MILEITGKCSNKTRTGVHFKPESVFILDRNRCSDWAGIRRSEKIQDVSVAECLLYFKNYVGKDYVESIVDITTLSPTVESWDSGDREVACLAYDMNKNKLNVSVKNSKL